MKTMILPIVTILFLMTESVTGHKISVVSQDEVANSIVVLITTAISIWGVWKNHHRKGR